MSECIQEVAETKEVCVVLSNSVKTVKVANIEGKLQKNLFNGTGVDHYAQFIIKENNSICISGGVMTVKDKPIAYTLDKIRRSSALYQY
ncbi:MAG: hypothetical protein EZS28_028084 [Streblomastix strix]|uniref:Uncharacterized protein n=1 Tax=Streblomastix strix TaxID=222440 RepID=A0A5J4V113_9EUKA|nr:MAG: hypothetical protein EZS28_028084 [Streblomastix strix]